MKFSIVITTYNRLALLQRAIQSALSQTIPCEIVVVDDCSNDGTQNYLETLCPTLPEGQIIYHRNEVNRGHSQSINIGVTRATGDWIKTLDDDDYLDRQCLEIVQEAIALRPQAVICSCQTIQVNANEEELGRTLPVGQGIFCYLPQEDIHRGMLVEEVPFGTPVQVAFRRDAFEQSGGWDSDFDANFDDIDSWIKIARFGDAIFVNRCLAYRTLWEGGYNQKFSVSKRLNTHILIKQKIYSLIHPKYRHQTPKFKHIESYLKLHWSLVALKQRDYLNASQIFWQGAFSATAWQLLYKKHFVKQHSLYSVSQYLTLK
ncbi:MAG: glycosyltransferase family 2 protein [Cyanobacteria bacterium P01_E01_bin.42]